MKEKAGGFKQRADTFSLMMMMMMMMYVTTKHLGETQ
jgi:hypothetical protein